MSKRRWSHKRWSRCDGYETPTPENVPQLSVSYYHQPYIVLYEIKL